MTLDTRHAARHVVLWAAFLVGLAVLGRLVPHLPNVTPMIAVALFAGFLFRGWLALLVPLAALLASDLAIGFYPPGEMAFVYLAMALSVAVGRVGLGRGLSVAAYGLTTLGGALVFHFVSNLGVWLFGGIYPLTVEGLIACYVAAMPFFKYALLGTALWLAVLIGLHALVQRLAARPGMTGA